MKLAEIASFISGYLERFEKDKSINSVKDGRRLPPYYNAYAAPAGRYVNVTYVTFQGKHSLTKDDAIRYLEWLRAGNIGKHYKALSFNEQLSELNKQKASAQKAESK